MASTKLLICCLALVVASLVDSTPLNKRCCHKKKRECPDNYIGEWFNKIIITVDCDFDWINYLIKLIECKSDVAEYGRIMELYAEFQSTRGCFDNCYDNIQNEIFDLIGGYRKKYSPLSICYTERAVSCRKRARRNLFPDLCKYRNCYTQLLALIEEFCRTHSIDVQPRPIALPRVADYSFMNYYPSSSRSKELVLLIETCFTDYRYIYDLINKLPECDRRKKLIDEIIIIWIEFDNSRRSCDFDYYPRFLDCNEDQGLIDNIYLEYINKLRPCQTKFASCWFDIFTQYEDLCRDMNIPLVDYVDYENFKPDQNIRGLYFPSKCLQEYFSNQIITPRMDYVTCNRQWDELNFPCGCPEWKRREKIICEMKRILRELERCINKLIRDAFRRCLPYFDKCDNWDNFDVDYKSMIDEIIGNCNNELYPYILEFREQYYNNEDCLRPILKERGITDCSRNVIPCQTWGYDMTVYLCDDEITELIRWIENCFRTNYYGPVGDLVQLNFNEECEDRTLKRKCLKDLECIWIKYREILHEMIRRLIKLIRKRKCLIGSKEYLREIKSLREWCRPRFVDLIDRFKSRCVDINGILERLYKKKKDCGSERRYIYVEASFEITIKSGGYC